MREPHINFLFLYGSIYYFFEPMVFDEGFLGFGNYYSTLLLSAFCMFVIAV
jgi:hypothetical protein